ncbi:MAG: ABC transporter substrate-binding protein, partial [Chloroflexi bacterium]
MFRKTLLVTLLIIWLAACSPQAAPTAAPVATDVPATEAPTASPAPATLTFTDGLGREVTLEGPAQRVVSIAPSNTEILFAIGAGDQVVGRDKFSDYPEDTKNIADVGSIYESPNVELIVSLQPDLVLAAEINNPEQVK